MRLICLVWALALAGCATVRQVDTTDGSSIREALQIGDLIIVTVRDGQARQLTVVGLSDAGIDIRLPDGEPETIRYEEIVQLQVREPRPGRAVGLGLGIYVAFGALIYVLLDNAGGW